MHIKVPTVCGAINTVLGIIAVCRQATIHNASSCLVTFCVVKLCSLSGSTFIPSYSSQYKSNYEVNVNIIEEQLTHSLLTIYVVINGLALVWPHSLFTSNIHVCAHPPPLGKQPKDGKKPEPCKPILKVEYKTTRAGWAMTPPLSRPAAIASPLLFHILYEAPAVLLLGTHTGTHSNCHCLLPSPPSTCSSSVNEERRCDRYLHSQRRPAI